MDKKKIVVILSDDEIRYISSYSYISGYSPKWGDNLDDTKIKINLTDNLDDAFEWGEQYRIDTVYKNLRDCLIKELDVKAVFRVSSNVFKRYLKIKTLKEKCQKIN